MPIRRIFLASVVLSAAPLAAQTHTTVVDFDTQWGTGIWVLSPLGSHDDSGGRPGGNMRMIGNGLSGVHLSPIEDEAFVRDLTTDVRVRIGIDSVSLNSVGDPLANPLYVVFMSHALAQNGFAYAAVHYRIPAVPSADGWATFAVSFDPRSSVVPAGWEAYGGTEFALPQGVTFADVMASYDRLEFTNLPPGHFSGSSYFDMRFDNAFITRLGDAVFAQGFDTTR